VVRVSWGFVTSVSLLLTAGALVVVPSSEWLPAPPAIRSTLEVLLGAQAAIAAITLAVMIFVLQAVSARSDADAATYQEYISRSHVRGIFAASLVAVGMTGAALLFIQPGGLDETFGGARGLRNVFIIGAVAFLAIWCSRVSYSNAP
jgi:hypothetical protein